VEVAVVARAVEPGLVALERVLLFRLRRAELTQLPLVLAAQEAQAPPVVQMAAILFSTPSRLTVVAVERV
jgi:hypothetical protein